MTSEKGSREVRSTSGKAQPQLVVNVLARAQSSFFTFSVNVLPRAQSSFFTFGMV